MLVLSRKKNESIVINNDITIVVVEIRGDKVRLGVEAPKEVPVHRTRSTRRFAATNRSRTRRPAHPRTTRTRAERLSMFFPCFAAFLFRD